MYLVSLTGPFFGYLLRKIAQQEVQDGKRYFQLLHNLLFLVTLSVVGYALWASIQFLWLTVFLVIGANLFVLQLKRKLHPGFAYGLFLLPAFLHSFHTVTASVIFIYGLPVGTLYHGTRS